MNQAHAEASGILNRFWSTDWRLFFALSRTPHAVLDMCTPALAAVLWLGGFPPISVTLVGLITAFSGYTAVYALNDLVDCKIDRQRLGYTENSPETVRVDEILMRHPVAQGALSFETGLAWFALWSLIALAGAWWLNPVCVILFALAASMEVVYCKLLRISHLKIIPSTIVKATGGLAGLYAVETHPDPAFVALLVIWLGAWEIGGQNIANDIVDMQADQKVSARTTLTILGLKESVFILLAGISVASSAGILMYWFSGPGVGLFYLFGAAVLSWILLLQPARQVYLNPDPKTAASLFNRASYMPLGFLVIALISLLLS